VTNSNVVLVWNPREDITIYELALCMPFASRNMRPTQSAIEQLPEVVWRHFSVIYDKNNREDAQWVASFTERMERACSTVST
jgi:hypothetical protein